MSSESQTKCQQTLQDLFQKYENNEYMLQRIHTHIVNCLPNTLDIELVNHEKRICRNIFLTNEQQIFIQVFLQKNLYYYLSSNNCFYEYNGVNYSIVKEDDIIHKLLSSISRDRVLLEWKYKTKIHIIKLIKERSLLNSIPESDTIQHVLNVLYPSVFVSKNHAKYFLNIIGDNILKKNQHLIFMVSPYMKKILNELEFIASDGLGVNNITQNFMTKYHESHSYEKCRFINMNETFAKPLWVDMLKKNVIDLICVAVNYSKRYDNSDYFIENKVHEELKKYVYYIKNNTPQHIINDFCNKYIIETDKSQNPVAEMEWKNLHFVWKQFLSDNQYPNMIYSNTLKQLMKGKYTYSEEDDTFLNITSKFLPIQSDFIKFWNTTITLNESQTPDNFDNEMEIDELCGLFRVWAKNCDNLMTNGNITEENVLKILKHFFPSIEIIEDKYVLNITSIIWNKITDINTFFVGYLKDILKDYTLALISFDDVYNYYYKFCNQNSLKFIVSKRYFEKHIYFTFPDYIVYEKFIKIDLLLS
jgi:hypothetical protein